MTPKPLADQRIVVTRSASQASATLAVLDELGAAVILFPTIQFVPIRNAALDEALRHLDSYDWLIFSSTNAVRFFCQVRAQSSADRQQLPRVAAVGAVTADVAVQSGIQVDFVPETFTGEAIARGLGNVRGQRILLPRSRLGRQQIVDTLRTQGAEVDDVPIYDTVVPTPDPEALQKLVQGFEGILFASPSSVRNFLQLTATHPAVHQSLQDAVVACIGPITARACAEAGIPVSVSPDQYTLSDLIQALIQQYNNHSS